MSTLALHRWILDSAEKLPRPPDLVQQLVAAASDPATNVDDLAAIAMRDPVLVAHIMREANSAAISNGGIETIEQAVVRLGSARLIAVAADGLMGKGLELSLHGYGLGAGELRRQAVLSTHAVASCIRRTSIPIGREVIVAALLHDIGKTIIDPLLNPSPNPQMLAHDLSCMFLEQEAVGTDHVEVGSYLLESWGLPNSIVDAVLHHHDQEGEIGSRVLLVADWVSDLALGRHEGSAPPSGLDAAVTMLGLDGKIEKVIADVYAML